MGGSDRPSISPGREQVSDGMKGTVLFEPEDPPNRTARRKLRESMLAQGPVHVDAIALEMRRRWGYPPMLAYRYALGDRKSVV